MTTFTPRAGSADNARTVFLLTCFWSVSRVPSEIDGDQADGAASRPSGEIRQAERSSCGEPIVADRRPVAAKPVATGVISLHRSNRRVRFAAPGETPHDSGQSACR